MKNLLKQLQLLSNRLRLSRSNLRQRLKTIDKQFCIIVFLLILLCALTLPISLRFSSKEEISPSSEEPEIVSASAEEFEDVHEDLDDAPVEPQQELSLDEIEKRVALGEVQMTMKTMEKGDNLIGLLTEQKVPSNERMEIIEALETLIDLKTLKPGLSFLFFHEDDKLIGLAVRPKENQALSVLREKDNSWVTFSQAGRVETRQEHITVTIERTFEGSAKKAEVPSNVINQIIGALDGEFDFATDVKPGNEVEIITESKVTQSGLEIGSKQVIYIGVKTDTKELHKYSYNNVFYDARGRTSEKMLMKRPLKGRPRLSSPYGKRRHPILQYEIFHKGVDLAIAKNTPVLAAADGTIEIIGRKGSYGKYIRMGHKGGYQTAYAHLNGYRQDLKVGSKVKRGDVIAYVGSTGRSTGPHLHFEVLKNNQVVNPFGNNKIASTQLSGFELEKFQSWAESIHPDFKKHLVGKIPPVPPQKPF